MDEATGPLSPEQIAEFWEHCDHQLYTCDGGGFAHEGGALLPPEEEHLEAERRARRLWALAESRPGGPEAVLREAPFDVDYFLTTMARLGRESWASSPARAAARKFRVARWLLSLRGADGSRWEFFVPERLLRALGADPEADPAVSAFVVSVADGEGHAWTPPGAALRAAALARGAPPAGGRAAEA